MIALIAEPSPQIRPFAVTSRLSAGSGAPGGSAPPGSYRPDRRGEAPHSDPVWCVAASGGAAAGRSGATADRPGTTTTPALPPPPPPPPLPPPPSSAPPLPPLPPLYRSADRWTTINHPTDAVTGRVSRLQQARRHARPAASRRRSHAAPAVSEAAGPARQCGPMQK